MTEALVALRGVRKTFPSGVTALDGLDLDIAPGEFVALLGPSGCGKSTALRLIAGLSEPSAGVVAAPRGARAHGIGYVFQEPTLMPWANVAANVRLPLTLRGEPASDAPVEALLGRMGLSAFAGAYPRELSGGMKMRVSIARALATEPALLLMDEPFAALDELTRFRLNNELLALWRTLHMTVIFVTHSVFESVYLAQRVVVMTGRPGRVATQVAVDPAGPRNDDFRTSAPYAALCREVSQALRMAIGEDHA